jgi:hypothetical protein
LKWKKVVYEVLVLQGNYGLIVEDGMEMKLKFIGYKELIASIILLQQPYVNYLVTGRHIKGKRRFRFKPIPCCNKIKE